MSVTVGIHMFDDTEVRAVDLTQYGEDKTPLVKIEFKDNNLADIYIKSHEDIAKILRALAEAGKMIPVTVPAPVTAPAPVTVPTQVEF